MNPKDVGSLSDEELRESIGILGKRIALALRGLSPEDAFAEQELHECLREAKKREDAGREEERHEQG